MTGHTTRVATPRHRDATRATTIVRTPYRYGVVEMGTYHDVTVFERELRRACRRKTVNVSPASGRGVTFEKHADQWPRYRTDIENAKFGDGRADDPDWWYLSGHHAPMGDGEYYASAGAHGFFNEHYYDAWKRYVNRGQKLPGAIPGAVFAATSEVQSIGVKLKAQQLSNPLFDRTAVETCKGMFLIGCHTLTGKAVRETFDDLYPKAALFGYFDAKAPGTKGEQARHIRSIFAAIGRGRPSLFEGPSGYLAAHGGKDRAWTRIVSKLSRYTRKRHIAVYHERTLYLAEYSWAKRAHWHADGLTRFGRRAGFLGKREKLVLCPVRGKPNPFDYAVAGRFITGSRSRSARVSEHFRFAEYSKPGFKRISTYLIQIVEGIRRQLKRPVQIERVAPDGKTVEIRCDFGGLAEEQKVRGLLNGLGATLTTIATRHYRIVER